MNKKPNLHSQPVAYLNTLLVYLVLHKDTCSIQLLQLQPDQSSLDETAMLKPSDQEIFSVTN